MYCEEIENMFSLVLSSYRNMSGSLGEREMLWEHKPIGKCFHNFFEFSQTFCFLSLVFFDGKL